jgi:Na+-transporting methylmalonyl-CoA/oxaloacetate decarboxylase beta subunit
MKIAVLLSAIAGVSAFAPASQSAARVGSELNAADLSSMRGVGPETAGKVVSTTSDE